MKTQIRSAFTLLVPAILGLFLLSYRVDAAKGGIAVRLPPYVPVIPPSLTLQPVSPCQIIGFIQKATLDNPSDTFSGGTLVVNGITITVPRNPLFQMPATSMTWQEMFKLAPAPYGLNASGGPQ